MWKVECPYCHHFFSVVTEEKNKLVQDEKVEDYKESKARRAEDLLESLIPMSRRVPGSLGSDVKADLLTYEYKFKCKHCGKEWTELREKERESKDPYAEMESAERKSAESKDF
jgi:DNA-directed RNA polymerase subunit M/transcription elongation factor TFIIS